MRIDVDRISIEIRGKEEIDMKKLVEILEKVIPGGWKFTSKLPMLQTEMKMEGEGIKAQATIKEIIFGIRYDPERKEALPTANIAIEGFRAEGSPKKLIDIFIELTEKDGVEREVEVDGKTYWTTMYYRSMNIRFNIPVEVFVNAIISKFICRFDRNEIQLYDTVDMRDIETKAEITDRLIGKIRRISPENMRIEVSGKEEPEVTIDLIAKEEGQNVQVVIYPRIDFAEERRSITEKAKRLLRELAEYVAALEIATQI